MTRGRSWLLRCYPAKWRERYAEDLAAYLDDAYGNDLPLHAAASLVACGLRERARTVRVLYAASATVCASLLTVGICLVISGSSTYDAILLDGHTWPLGHASDVAPAEVFQAGHSTSQIVAGWLVMVVAVAVGVLLASGRVRLAAAATAAITLGLGISLIVAGNSTYEAVRVRGHVRPVASADLYRSIGLHPFAAGRSISQILTGAALLVVTAGAAIIAVSYRSRRAHG